MSVVSSDPRFYYRPIWNEYDFLGDYPRRGPFDAAILRGRHLAPHAPGSKFANSDPTGRRLADVLLDSGGPYVVDPDTPVLTAAVRGAERIAAMPHAQVLPLPLSRLSFASSSDRQAFVVAAVRAQAGAQLVVAPYFPFESQGDGWHRLNLQLIADTVAIAGGRPVATFVQVRRSVLERGEVAASAPAYADAGVEIMFLRIQAFYPDSADPAAVRAYREAIDAFAAADVPAVADGVGRFGLVLTAAGAAGFSCGGRDHKFVAEEVIYDAEEMPSDPQLYEVPARWFALRAAQARRAAAAGLLPACPEPGCAALASGTGASDLKEHMIHLFTRDVRAMSAAGASQVRQHLQHQSQGVNTAWTAAL